jgi:hypothetical protein
MIKPSIFQLPVSKTVYINESKTNESTSNFNSQPLFKYGFHHYINQSKDKLVILNNDDLKGKNFYNVVEPFDDNIPNYDNSIKKINKKLIGIDTDKNKLELWEILSIIGESGNLYINDTDYDPIIKAFYSKSGLKFKALEDFKKSDIYININDPDIDIKQKEQAHYYNFVEALGELTDGLNKDGCAVIKLYDTYTEVSVKLIKLMSEMFEETYIYKPYMSYGRDSGKYIFGIKYKDNYKNSGMLMSLLKKIKTEKLNNIFSDIDVPQDFEFVMKYMNIQIGNYEHKMINILVDYIKKSNYFGDVYHTSVENQKKTSEFWIENFYASNYKKAKDELKSLITKTIKENNEKMGDLFKVLI